MSNGSSPAYHRRVLLRRAGYLADKLSRGEYGSNGGARDFANSELNALNWVNEKLHQELLDSRREQAAESEECCAGPSEQAASGSGEDTPWEEGGSGATGTTGSVSVDLERQEGA